MIQAVKQLRYAITVEYHPIRDEYCMYPETNMYSLLLIYTVQRNG